jgi:two-component system C4-dicarboxylate transport sensor histidine kinase DctB
VVQILFNLLVNSAQALHGRSSPRIEVSVHEDEDHAWVLVTDNGPGLPPHVRQNLFRPFTTTKARGHGLGLALSHNLAAKAGGDLESLDPPEGAGFRLRLKKVCP